MVWCQMRESEGIEVGGWIVGPHDLDLFHGLTRQLQTPVTSHIASVTTHLLGYVYGVLRPTNGPGLGD